MNEKRITGVSSVHVYVCILEVGRGYDRTTLDFAATRKFILPTRSGFLHQPDGDEADNLGISILSGEYLYRECRYLIVVSDWKSLNEMLAR
jgi:hypothetical protein